MKNESPDTIHGRMKESAHIAGYGLARAFDNLKWLLEEARFKQLSSGYSDVNEFLRDSKDAFKLLKIDPEERKQIAELVKEFQPEASQRAIADMVGVGKDTVAKDLGYRKSIGGKPPETPDLTEDIGGKPPSQPWTADPDYDPAAPSRRGDDWYQSQKSIAWETPQWLFDMLHNEFHFELDVCASPDNAKCSRYYTKENDGLSQDWTGVCWMNPPYGRVIKDWMDKAKYSAELGATVVCLVPARPDTEWWWDNCIYSEIRFIKGRLKWPPHDTIAPFPSAVIVMGNEAKVVWWDVRPK